MAAGLRPALLEPAGSDAVVTTAVEPSRIIRTYYVLAGLYTLAASIIWGINTLFLLDAGLSIFEVFVANAAFSVGTVLFEIPTGVVADTLGRRMSFLLSTAVLGVTTLGYVGLSLFGLGLAWFAVVSMFMALGFTFYSGAMEAWLVDALHAGGYDGQLDGIFARGQIVTGAAMLIGTIGGGLLGTVDLRIPYVVRAVVLGVLFVVAFASMYDIGFAPRRPRASELPGEMSRIARDSITYGWSRRETRLLMMQGLINGTFVMWAFYAWQPHFLELLGRNAVWVAGVVSALIALSTMAGNSVVEWMTRYCGRRTTLMLWSAAVLSAASIGIGLADSFWVAVALLLTVTAAMGVASPVRMAFLHQVIPGAQRASVVSFDSMVSGLGGFGGQVALGAVGQSQGLGAGYVAGGVFTVLALPLLWAVRRVGGEADQIVGRKTAAVGGTCAAQGLPAIGGVESVARPEAVPGG